MGILARLVDLLGRSRPTDAAALRTADRRRSAEGWQDTDLGWPEGATLYVYRFSTPWDAVDAIEGRFDALRRLDGAVSEDAQLPPYHREETLCALQGYGQALQALGMVPAEMARRKGTYGRLTGVLSLHLESAPNLLGNPLVRLGLASLCEGLRACGDTDLAAAGIALSGTLAVAAEALRRIREEASATMGQIVRHRDTPRLDGKTLMGALLEECLKDGAVSREEHLALEALRKFLGLSKGDYGRLYDSVWTSVEEGRVSGEGTLEAGEFLERIYRIALVDGEVTRDEEDLLAAVADLLGVSSADFDTLRRQARRSGDLAAEVGWQAARALFEAGKSAEAEKAYRASLATLGKVLGPDHPGLVQPLLGYAALLKATGREQLAATFEARARVLQARY